MATLRVYIQAVINLPEGGMWITKQDWDEEGSNALKCLRELFDEDHMAFLDEVGGMEMVQSAEWID